MPCNGVKAGLYEYQIEAEIVHTTSCSKVCGMWLTPQLWRAAKMPAPYITPKTSQIQSR